VGGAREPAAVDVIDDVIVAADAAPDGRATLDISAHGGVRVVECLLLSLRADGVDIVDNSMLPDSAFPSRNAIESEALQALVRAHTPRAVHFLAYQRAHLPDYLRHIAQLAIDDPQAARRMLGDLAAHAQAWRHLVEGATLVLSGPVNAGKSTLANRLLGREHSLVSPVPGTTRDWVGETAAIRGIPVTIVDTAGLPLTAGFGVPDVTGLRETADALELEGIRRGQRQSQIADLQLFVVDRSSERRGLSPGERRGSSPPHSVSKDERSILVANKSDLPPAWNPADYDWKCPCVTVSAATGEGLDGLLDLIAARLGLDDSNDQKPGLFTQRQRDAVMRLNAAVDLPPAPLARRILDELLITDPPGADKPVAY
jgi:tRNA modification GTPase